MYRENRVELSFRLDTNDGMKLMDSVSIVEPSLLRPNLLVADTVYNPLETRLIQDAKMEDTETIVFDNYFFYSKISFKYFSYRHEA